MPDAVTPFRVEVGDDQLDDLRSYEQPARSGHFAAWEQPELFVDQVRRAFRTMR
jgi:pimeloyl-ACP methyl ester carboxylesterase